MQMIVIKWLNPIGKKYERIIMGKDYQLMILIICPISNRIPIMRRKRRRMLQVIKDLYQKHIHSIQLNALIIKPIKMATQQMVKEEISINNNNKVNRIKNKEKHMYKMLHLSVKDHRTPQ